VKTVDRFEGEYAFLSNFYEHEFTYDGLRWPTAEHAYQASKTLDRGIRLAIRGARSAGLAKKMGNRVLLRRHWEATKVGVMREILRAKFLNDPVLCGRLIGTGDDYLVEGNTWGDTFWGMVNSKGNNWLGLLLMEVREEARALEEYEPQA
jgi:hypothetical protein